MIPQKLEAVLDQVEKPGRYIGGEFNEIKKDKKGKTRVAFCFPDSVCIADTGGISSISLCAHYSRKLPLSAP